MFILTLYKGKKKMKKSTKITLIASLVSSPKDLQGDLKNMGAC